MEADGPCNDHAGRLSERCSIIAEEDVEEERPLIRPVGATGCEESSAVREMPAKEDAGRRAAADEEEEAAAIPPANDVAGRDIAADDEDEAMGAKWTAVEALLPPGAVVALRDLLLDDS